MFGLCSHKFGFKSRRSRPCEDYLLAISRFREGQKSSETLAVVAKDPDTPHMEVVGGLTIED
jgi:hypothetical protein